MKVVITMLTHPLHIGCILHDQSGDLSKGDDSEVSFLSPLESVTILN